MPTMAAISRIPLPRRILIMRSVPMLPEPMMAALMGSDMESHHSFGMEIVGYPKSRTTFEILNTME